MRSLVCVAAFLGLAGCTCGGTPPSPCEAECTQVPATECVGGNVRVYAVGPSCNAGCTYVFTDRKCDHGCADGLCLPPGSTGGGAGGGSGGGAGGGAAGGSGGSGGGDAGTDPCLGVSCNAPPASTCAGAQQLKVFEAPGTCGAGQCQYGSHFETCANGCANGQCTGSPCQGVTCLSPPPAACADAQTLTTYSAAGTCAGGACSYAPSATTCPFGCANGACNGDPCLGKTCNQPPAAFCATASTRRSFSAAGTCAGGSCTYASADTTCPFGCANGVCNADPCTGVTCATPPAAFCSSATALRTFAAAGTCAQGSCSYAPSDTTCPYGCGNGACLPNPCTGVTCNQPPAPSCVGTSARTWSAAGTCSNGSCSYASVDVPCSNGCTAGLCNGPTCNGVTCNTPPADACTSATRLKTYARLGTCASNACSYQAINVDCSQGCFNGACITGSWTVETPPVPAVLLRQSLAIDAAGTPHVAGCTAAGDLIYRSKNDFGWFDETVDPLLGAYCLGAIAVDAQGPAIAYFDSTNGDLRFARRVNGAWTLKELVVTAGTVGVGASLTFDPANGQAVAAYYDSSQQQVRVARRTAANTWTTELAAGSVTLYYGATTVPVTSARFDAQGTLHVVAGEASYSSSGGPVVWARKEAGAWTNEAIAPYGYVGRSAVGVAPNGEVRVLWRYSEAHVRTRSAAGTIDDAARGFGGNPGLGAALDAARFPDVLQAGLSANGVSLSTAVMGFVNGFWTSGAMPFVPSMVGVLHDAKLHADGRTVMITSTGLVATAAQCQPQCSGRTCGDDACGGSCGSCSGAQSCSPAGTCGAWAGETIRGMQVAGCEAALALSPAGGVHAMVGVGTSQYFPHTYLQRTLTGWTAGEPVASGIVSSRDGFALNPAGVPLLAYQDTGIGVRTRGTPWATDVAASDYGSRPGLLVDASGARKLIRAKLPNNTTWELEVWTQAGAGWTKETVASGAGQVGAHSAALDAAGKLHLVYQVTGTGAGGAASLKYATNASGAWVVEGVHSQALASYAFFQMRVTAAGVPHVVLYPWLDGSYAVRGAGGWTVEALPATLKLDYSGNAYVPRFALDGQGVPNLVVPHPGTPPRLDHAVRTGAGTWTIGVVPTWSLFAATTVPIDFQFDSTGKPHLLFFDDSQLRHVFKP